MNQKPKAGQPDSGFGHTFEGLMALLRQLRGDDGCPWDRKQTSMSLRNLFLEEVCELLEAIDAADAEGIAEETGDVLMHAGMQIQFASEAGQFSEDDVFAAIIAKLVHRHPHVFGNGPKDLDASEVLANWEDLKRAEGRRHSRDSAMDGVPAALPSLAAAQTIQRKAARTGFDWDDAGGVLEKVGEELQELHEADTPCEREDEFGDLLFTIVNAARWLEVDAEAALRRANTRFSDRFRAMELMAKEAGSDFQSLGPSEKEALWERAKQERG